MSAFRLAARQLAPLQQIERVGHHGGAISVEELLHTMTCFIDDAHHAISADRVTDARKAVIEGMITLRHAFSGSPPSVAAAASHLFDRFRDVAMTPTPPNDDRFERELAQRKASVARNYLRRAEA